MDLESRIEELFALETTKYGNEYFGAFDELKAALNEGRVRAASHATSAECGPCFR